jgi:hypothetical protein
MLVEVESAFTDEVCEARLPRTPSDACRHTLTSGEGSEAARDVQAFSKLFVEVGSIIRSPRLGQNHDVRFEVLHDVERFRGPTPTVDAGVKVESRDTHR